MKILLIKPPFNPNVATVSIYEPLELEYLAASVKDSNVRILDMRIDKNLKKEIKSFSPDMVGITAYTCDYNTVIRILREIKEFNSTIVTVVGGSHATFAPDDFVLPHVDAIFIGYADTTFPQYVNSLNNAERLKTIPNIGLINGGEVYYTEKIFSVPDLDSIPFPDRSLTRKYRKNYYDPMRNRLALIMTSKGCPFRCNFCACWKLMNGHYTSRTPESIINELKSLPEDIDVVYFSDDNTFNDTSRMWRLSELIKKNNIRKKLQMYARADTIVKNKPLFEEMASAGLQFISIGLESFCDKDLDYYKKKTTSDLNTRAIRILKELNIYIIALFIVRPDYTKEDFGNLLNYVFLNNLFRPAFPVLTPLPGTELYEETLDSVKNTNYDFYDFAHSVLPTKLNPKEFYKKLTGLYLKSFSFWRIIQHRICRLLSVNNEKYFTDNTDGLTIYRLLIVYFYSLFLVLKLRFVRKSIKNPEMLI